MQAFNSYCYFCRIDLNFVIKVADFGLAERLGVAKDYIRQTQDSNIKLPLKWMALESMNDRVFSEHSDVVSKPLTYFGHAADSCMCMQLPDQSLSPVFIF